jgi:predicted NUDIX family NTP pyrophosphohydrolase
MIRQSAGLLMYRFGDKGLEVFLVHPGGPYWAAKDEGAWSIPKGEYTENEDSLEAAKREFFEETGFKPEGDFKPLSPIKQPGGKWVSAWAFAGDCDPSLIKSNTFTIEWPPRSGKKMAFPEIDQAAWFGVDEAVRKLNKNQIVFLKELKGLLKETHPLKF